MNSKSQALKESDSSDIEGLMSNGLDFLEKARTELDIYPKFSIVSFWTAVEILLKVPLALKDWQLLVKAGKERAPDREKYLRGDFNSVDYSETRKLLKQELGFELDNVTLGYFDRVRKHRNRVVHFFHDAAEDVDLDAIRNEQADAWFALNRLVRDSWLMHFNGLNFRDFHKLEYGLIQGSKYYAAAKFRSIRPMLNEYKRQGAKISRCKHCSQKSYVTQVYSAKFPCVHETCYVCSASDCYISVVCPDCEATYRLEQDDTPFVCKTEDCGFSETRYELLSDDGWSHDDYHNADTPAGCVDCDGWDAVCHSGDGYLCTLCFSYQETIGCCEHCNYCSTKVDEYSSLKGCSFCDGPRALWDDD